jgi:hypothetical protein
MRLISKLFSCVLFTGMMSLASCGIFQSATTAALDVLKEKSPELIAKAGDAAKLYWAENKDEILTSAKDAAGDLAASAFEQSKDYVDTKLVEKRQDTVDKLLAKGYTIADMDANNDGEVSDDELADFLKSNPMAMWYAGVGGLAVLGLWYAKQKMRRKEDEPPEVVAEE